MESIKMSEINDLGKAFAQTSIKNECEDSIISFEGRGLKLETEKEASVVIKEIEKAPIVHGIIFKGNTIGAEAAKKIGQALAKRPEFKRALWSDMFTGRSKAEIPPALLDLCGGISSALAHLVELDLSDNAFGPNGARGIEGFLRTPSAYSLEILKLNNNGLGIGGCHMIAAALKDCYHSSKEAGTPLKLRIFVAGRNRLENKGATALAEIFKLVGTLEEVTMPQNGIYHDGIAAIADAFSHNPQMRVINLSDNTFTEQGAKAMAKVLPKLANLEKINFDDCLLRPGGGSILADALMHSCDRLQELRLCGNELNTQAATELVNAVSNKPNLTLLDLNANSLGEEGINITLLLAQELKIDGKLGAFDEDDDTASDADGADGDASEDESGSVQDENSSVTNPTAKPANWKAANGASDKKSRAMTPDIAKFNLHPDAASLITLAESFPEKMDSLLQHQLRNPDDVIVFVFGIASLMVNDPTNERNHLIQRCCNAVLKGAFETKDNAQLTNAILERLGVIKSENKLEIPPNVDGIISMLSNAAKSDWFPQNARSTLAFVFERRKEKLKADESLVTELMKGLALK